MIEVSTWFLLVIAIFVFLIFVMAVIVTYNTRPKVGHNEPVLFTADDMDTMLAMLLRVEGKLVIANRSLSDSQKLNVDLFAQLEQEKKLGVEREKRILQLKSERDLARDMAMRVSEDSTRGN